MGKNSSILPPEDYLEPQCVLCGAPYGAEEIKSIPQQRIAEKLDEYMSRRDYAGVERHLRYWLEEARLGRDQRGELMVLGELVGHYRKTHERDKAIVCEQDALRLLHELDYEDSMSAGTTYVNIATARNSFGDNDRALELFQKAKAIYEASPGTDPKLLGGLYNNMALTCAALGDYAQAMDLYDKAMEVMGKVPSGQLEQAVTCLNRANAIEARDGMEQGETAIFALLDQAEALFDDESLVRDGYYAYVCETCAPTFAYYGYFVTAEDLKERARIIYERA